MFKDAPAWIIITKCKVQKWHAVPFYSFSLPSQLSNRRLLRGISPEAGFPSPAAIWNFYQECGKLKNSPKLGRLGKQNLQIPLKLFRRTWDRKDHTFMHVNCTLTYRAGEEQSWLHTAEADAINLNPLPETSKSYSKICCTCHHPEGPTLFWLGFCILG